MMPIRESRVTEAKMGIDPQGVRKASAQERMGCHRCGGLLVQDWVVSLSNDGGDVQVLTYRCLQCGEILDPVVLHNRFSTNAKLRGKSMAKPRKLRFAHG